jgi:5-aminopentanamidase
MRIGIVQTKPVFGQAQENLSAAVASIEGHKGNADLWILPELFSTGYAFGSRETAERLAEPIPDGPTTQGLIAFAARAGVAIVAGIAERAPAGRIFNSAIAVDSTSGFRALYRKTHLFDYEKEWFNPGDTGFQVITLAGARLGMMICFDWRFPESARTLALQGAQILAHPSNLVQPHCQDAMVTRALENRVFTATANRIGTEDRAGLKMTFTGRSRIIAPTGHVLAEAPINDTAIIVAEMKPDLADDKAVTSHNDVIRDRRPEFYV